MSNTTPLTGMGPISFTDSTIGELSVPLSAFQLSGSTVQLTSAWDNILETSDATVLLALAQGKFATSEIIPLPSPLAVPALVFTAAKTGTGGNNITVTLSVATGDTPLDGTVNIEAKEQDSFANLLSVSQAANAVGVDNTSGTVAGLPAAGGLIEIVNDGSLQITSTDLPNAATYVLSSTNPEPVAGPSSTLFNIQARVAISASTPTITVTITQNSGGTAFSIEATYDSGTPSPLSYSQLAALAADAPHLALLIGSVGAPPGGFALPAGTPTNPRTVALSGGGALAATGVAYTS